MLENRIDEFVKKLIDYYESIHLQKITSRVNISLALDGNFELIETLRHAQNKEPGYGTIVVPKQGFSDDDDVHNLVLDWLCEQKINVLNVQNEIANLEYALYGAVK